MDKPTKNKKLQTANDEGLRPFRERNVSPSSSGSFSGKSLSFTWRVDPLFPMTHLPCLTSSWVTCTVSEIGGKYERGTNCHSGYGRRDRASICQIGIVHVRNGEIEDQWQTLINPEDWFDPWHVSIHGIDENDVRNSPTLPEGRDELRRGLRGSVLVSHTSFDRVALERAMTRHDAVRPRTASGYLAR